MALMSDRHCGSQMSLRLWVVLVLGRWMRASAVLREVFDEDPQQTGSVSANRSAYEEGFAVAGSPRMPQNASRSVLTAAEMQRDGFLARRSELLEALLAALRGRPPAPAAPAAPGTLSSSQETAEVAAELRHALEREEALQQGKHVRHRAVSLAGPALFLSCCICLLLTKCMCLMMDTPRARKPPRRSLAARLAMEAALASADREAQRSAGNTVDTGVIGEGDCAAGGGSSRSRAPPVPAIA
eukprot:TRINITY_DN19950_c0_g1_i1.p1 TRINITY_DN19950_c0_g1~~TRINITY_DN19950_c0_g1_i1.p1  ORF type:complete len:242 (+),score=45.57 TRINITY_DN19950_c0_g1_i1:129-854(+)